LAFRPSDSSFKFAVCIPLRILRNQAASTEAKEDLKSSLGSLLAEGSQRREVALVSAAVYSPMQTFGSPPAKLEWECEWRCFLASGGWDSMGSLRLDSYLYFPFFSFLSFFFFFGFVLLCTHLSNYISNSSHISLYMDNPHLCTLCVRGLEFKKKGVRSMAVPNLLCPATYGTDES
jgi:hypothetical protein